MQTFTVSEAGKPTMEVYENRTDSPSWTRTFTVQSGGASSTK